MKTLVRHSLQTDESQTHRIRSVVNSFGLLYALQHFGVCLSGAGRYDAALQAFDEACAFGRTCGAFPLLARATSMSITLLLSRRYFVGAANRSMGARELAHRVAFEPPLVSAG